MVIEIVQIFSKPSLEIPWFHEIWEPSHMDYITTKYKDTGKYRGNREILEDGLTLIITHTFIDNDALNEWKADPYLTTMKENRDAHNLANGIEQLV